jgi:hypothetical protein
MGVVIVEMKWHRFGYGHVAFLCKRFILGRVLNIFLLYARVKIALVRLLAIVYAVVLSTTFMLEV